MVQSQRPLLVAVYPGQPPAVVAEAARLAAAMNCPIVCAYANPARYPVSGSLDGSVDSAPLDPDFMDDDGDTFPVKLAARLGKQLDASHIQWRPLLLAGDAAAALARCAEIIHPSMIVIGTSTDNHSPLHKILSRSVAVKLARAQRCSVLVVPVHHAAQAQDGQ